MKYILSIFTYNAAEHRPKSVIKLLQGNLRRQHNPALLIGLQLTPIGSICFWLKRALKSHSVRESNEKQISCKDSRNYTLMLQNSYGSLGEVPIRKD